MNELTAIYEYAEKLMTAGELNKLNEHLVLLDIDKLTIDQLIAWLTATLPVRSKLPYRRRLFREVKMEIKIRNKWEKGLLAGLE